MAKPKKLDHIAIICDGNRRWARFQGLAPFLGHERGLKRAIDELVDAALEEKLPYLTFWVFSTENWNRDKDEVEYLMNLFRDLFDKRINDLNEKGVRVVHLGNREGLAPDILERIDKGIEKTKNNTNLTVCVAMNYGGRDEIIRAIKKMSQDIQDGSFSLDQLDEKNFGQFLDTAGIPDPDLIIRTSGEQRLSGFLLWQQQYSEFYFPEFAFPDFTKERFKDAIDIFFGRDRRFGGN